MQAINSLERFLSDRCGRAPGQALVVAFSGGPDSTALLAAAVAVVGPRAPVWAAHYDHRLDPQSGSRATRAKRLADDIGARWTSEQAERRERMPAGVEDWARGQRYDFLERARRRTGSVAVLTAHHRRDQAETVLLRLLHGTGLRGLAGIQPWVGRVGRPWLLLPPADLHRWVAAGGWSPIDDPTNHDLTVPRNIVRHRLLPRLREVDPAIEERLADLAGAALEARDRCTARLVAELEVETAADGAASLNLQGLADLPQVLWPFALAALSKSGDVTGTPAPGSRRRQIAELRRQIGGERAEVCLGEGWRWLANEGRLWLKPRRDAGPAAGPWSVEVNAPGGVTLPDGGRLTIAPAEPEPWIRQGDPLRTGLELAPGVNLEVRNRRPGDRLQPLGCDYRRKLKDVLIDAKVPAGIRDHLPLLVADGSPVWVPGVTIDHRFRMRGISPLWVAQWHPVRRN